MVTVKSLGDANQSIAVLCSKWEVQPDLSPLPLRSVSVGRGLIIGIIRAY